MERLPAPPISMARAMHQSANGYSYPPLSAKKPFFTYATLYVHYFGDGFESDFLARKKAELDLMPSLRYS